MISREHSLLVASLLFTCALAFFIKFIIGLIRYFFAARTAGLYKTIDEVRGNMTDEELDRFYVTHPMLKTFGCLCFTSILITLSLYIYEGNTAFYMLPVIAACLLLFYLSKRHLKRVEARVVERVLRRQGSS